MTKERLENFRQLRNAVVELDARIREADTPPADEVRAQMKAQRAQMLAEYKEILRFVFQIDDLYIRRIVELRYIDGCTWSKIAAILGSGTPSGVCKACHRYLEKTN